MKKILCILMTATLLLSTAAFTFAAQAEAKLYSYYGNNMLFKQLDEAVLAGTGTPGANIALTLKNATGTSIQTANAVVAADGTFKVSFPAPAGGYEEYTITLSVNNKQFAALTGVVFGELWLAGGQSNMQMPLGQSETGMLMQQNGIVGSAALRFLAVPAQGGYDGNIEHYPAEPITDYANGANWYKGTDENVYGLSAVGYFFAEEMIKKLDMPVGILNANLGGTSILTWLSRETIENTYLFRNEIAEDGRYIALSDWKEDKVNFGSDMTCNFNDKIAPLKNFRLSGMIWYQGETDISWPNGRYNRAFDLLQKSYTEYFNYNDGLLPIVYTQLASYSYGDLNLLQDKNDEFAFMQTLQPDSRAVTSIYDVPLTYLDTTHAIHPICKQEVGEKMAFAAYGLVYDAYDSYTAPYKEKISIKDGSIYVTLANVGDGLVVDGDTIYGFAVCGEDGIYVAADAQIVNANTVRVYSESVKNPVSATYAFSQTNCNANLFATLNGEKTLAVSPFITNRTKNTKFWHNDAWTNCDYSEFWHCHANEFSGFYNTWNASKATLKFKATSAYSGEKGLLVCADGTADTFSISPNFTYNENGKQQKFHDIDTDWSRYGTLSFKVRVESSEAVRFDELRIETGNSSCDWYTAKNMDDATIPADGEWHTVTLDLNTLYPQGNKATSTYSHNVLNDVKNVTFTFADLGAAGADISVDDFRFTADGEEREDVNVQLNLKNESNFFAKIKAFFMTIISWFKALFS
ncbi:MAG: hypothetical protein IJA31_12595 [Clostridia bacterium]|nr:hypothetical protein [Clostridia bacterium]